MRATKHRDKGPSPEIRYETRAPDLTREGLPLMRTIWLADGYAHLAVPMTEAGAVLVSLLIVVLLWAAVLNGGHL